MDRKVLRAKEIAEMYSICEKTVWLYVRQGKLKATKVSHKVTVFCAKEVDILFGIKIQHPPIFEEYNKKRKAKKTKISEIMKKNTKKVIKSDYSKGLQGTYELRGAFNIKKDREERKKRSKVNCEKRKAESNSKRRVLGGGKVIVGRKKLNGVSCRSNKPKLVGKKRRRYND